MLKLHYMITLQTQIIKTAHNIKNFMHHNNIS